MRRAAVVTVLLLLAGVGCGDDGDPSPPGQAADATDAGDDPSSGGSGDATGSCAVISTEEAAEVFGVELEEGTELPAGCQWSLADGSGGFFEWQSLPVSAVQENREAADGAGMAIEEVSDVGEEAFLRNAVTADGQVTASELWFVAGGAGYLVRTGLVPASGEVNEAYGELAGLLIERAG
jgi:hypothetical protein